jgi:hypothetical protein
METKIFTAKDVAFEDSGTVQAVIATLNVIDKDGDVTLPGFFGEQPAAIASGHDRGRVGGKGRIYEVGDKAIFEGQYFLETIEGREQFLTAKAMGELQEWSYGFHLLEGGAKTGKHDGKPVRFLKPKDSGGPGVRVAEVSTVLVGAGEGTGTVSIKTAGLRFVDQAEQTAQAVELLLGRAEEIKTLRAEKGTELGVEAVARLLEVKTRLVAAAEIFGSLADVSPPTPDYSDDYTMTLMDVQRHLADARAIAAGR